MMEWMVLLVLLHAAQASGSCNSCDDCNACCNCPTEGFQCDFSCSNNNGHITYNYCDCEYSNEHLAWGVGILLLVGMYLVVLCMCVFSRATMFIPMVVGGLETAFAFLMMLTWGLIHTGAVITGFTALFEHWYGSFEVCIWFMIILPLVIGGMAISERMYLNYIALVLGIGPLICQCLVLVYLTKFSIMPLYSLQNMVFLLPFMLLIIAILALWQIVVVILRIKNLRSPPVPTTTEPLLDQSMSTFGSLDAQENKDEEENKDS